VLEMTMPEPMVIRSKNDTLFDGETLYTVTETMGRRSVQTSNEPLRNGVAPPGGKALFDILQERMTLALLPDTTVDGNRVFVFEGRPKPDGEAVPYEKLRYYIDQETGAQRKFETYESEHVVTATLKFENIELNPELPEDMFDPPAVETPAESAAEGDPAEAVE